MVSLVKEYLDKLDEICEQQEDSLRWICREISSLKKMLINKPELLKVNELIEVLERWENIGDLENIDLLHKELDEISEKLDGYI